MSNITSPVEAPGKRKEILTGKFTTTTGGALAASPDVDGFTLARTAAGRYVATLNKAYAHIHYASMAVEISATTAAVQAKGVVCALRSVSATGKTCTFQLTISPTAAAAGADADPEDGAVLRVMLVAKRGTL